MAFSVGLFHLIPVYFGQDFEIFGSTIPEIIETFAEPEPLESLTALRSEINNYVGNCGPRLAEKFEADFGTEVDAEAWAGSAAGFLFSIDNTLKHIVERRERSSSSDSS